MAVFVANLKIALMVNTWTIVLAFFVFGGMFSYFLTLVAVSSIKTSALFSIIDM